MMNRPDVVQTKVVRVIDNPKRRLKGSMMPKLYQGRASSQKNWDKQPTIKACGLLFGR
jgi:hypothetical protein